MTISTYTHDICAKLVRCGVMIWGLTISSRIQKWKKEQTSIKILFVKIRHCNYFVPNVCCLKHGGNCSNRDKGVTSTATSSSSDSQPKWTRCCKNKKYYTVCNNLENIYLIFFNSVKCMFIRFEGFAAI